MLDMQKSNLSLKKGETVDLYALFGSTTRQKTRRSMYKKSRRPRFVHKIGITESTISWENDFSVSD